MAEEKHGYLRQMYAHNPIVLGLVDQGHSFA